MGAKKKGLALVSIFLIFSLLLAGAFAWNDFEQHKTNLLSSEGTAISVTLNDNYNPPAAWSTGNIVPKNVSVTNDSESTGSVFVRLNVKEYMEAMEVDPNDWIVDGGGDKILFATWGEDDAANGGVKGKYMTYAQAQSAGYTDYTESAPIQIGVDAFGNPIMETFAMTNTTELRNGIYGKPMYVPGDFKVWGTQMKASITHELQHTEECDYDSYMWDGNGIERGSTGDYIRNYIDIIMGGSSGTDYMTLDEWYDPAVGNRTLGPYWILDESDGWAYWGEPLAPGATTKDLISGLRMAAEPGYYYEYYMHTDMEAIGNGGEHTIDEEIENYYTPAALGGNSAEKAELLNLFVTALRTPEAVGGIPNLASGRVLPAAMAGDTSDWIEIATYGGASLLLRANTIQRSAAFGANGTYSTSTSRTAINTWFNTAANIPGLKDYTVGNTLRDDVTNANVIGTYGRIYDVDGVTPIGFSLPKATQVASGDDVAFSLSFAEGAKFCSVTWWNAGKLPSAAYEKSDGLMRWGQLHDGPDAYWWTRTQGASAANASYVGIVGHANQTASGTATSEYGIRPAVWVKSEIFSQIPRRLPASVTGDTVDWIEIARNGDYSLILRTENIMRSEFRPAGTGNAYDDSTARTNVNTWIKNAANVPLLKSGGKIARNTVMGNVAAGSAVLGTYGNMDGFSAPVVGSESTVNPGTEDDVGFLLSFGEEAKYCSVTWWNLNKVPGTVGCVNSNIPGAVAAWSALSDQTSAHWWCRSPGSSGSHASIVWSNGNVTSGGASYSYGLRPALWVKSDIFERE